MSCFPKACGSSKAWRPSTMTARRKPPRCHRGPDMDKLKVGILTFSDGREYIHNDLLPVNEAYQDSLARTLEGTGQVEVVPGREIIWKQRLAQTEARRLAATGCDLTILNYAIWCFPHLSAIATAFAPGPYLLFCNLHPSEPGMNAVAIAERCGKHQIA